MRSKLVVATAVLLAAGLSAQSSPDRPFPLIVGDAAPALSVKTWVKGDAVKSFEPNKVYVVEFWATWCGPCIHGMPHLSELQEQYTPKGVRILGINVWDDPAKVEPFLENEVKMHKKPGDEIMQYTVGIEEKIADADPTKPDGGRMSKDWMLAAGQQGIPCAFIVDQKGKIAWIGHPRQMDKPLEQIVAGTWDLGSATKNYVSKIGSEKQVSEMFGLLRKGDFEKGYALGHELVKGPLADDSDTLNSLAWAIVNPKNPAKTKDLDLALAAATRANELTESKDGNVLDTLATVHHARGDLADAVTWQTLAVKHAEGANAADIAARLKEYEKELAASPAAAKKGDKPGAPKSER